MSNSDQIEHPTMKGHLTRAELIRHFSPEQDQIRQAMTYRDTRPYFASDQNSAPKISGAPSNPFQYNFYGFDFSNPVTDLYKSWSGGNFSLGENHNQYYQTPHHSQSQSMITQPCDFCRRDANFLCSACKKSRYCTTKCQVQLLKCVYQ